MDQLPMTKKILQMNMYKKLFETSNKVMLNFKTRHPLHYIISSNSLHLQSIQKSIINKKIESKGHFFKIFQSFQQFKK